MRVKLKRTKKLVLVSDGELDVGGLEAELKKGFFPNSREFE